MLYRFNSAAAGEIVMLAPHAEEIFSAIGRPLEQRGVIPVDQLPGVAAALQTAMDRSKTQAAAAGRTADENNRSVAELQVAIRTVEAEIARGSATSKRQIRVTTGKGF